MNRGRARSAGPATLPFLATLLFAVACATPAAVVFDADGQACDPRATGDDAVHVVVFTSHECPIANAYAPTLAGLAAAPAPAPVRWFLVHVDPDLSVAAARSHAQEYQLPGTLLFDRRHELAATLQVQKTPEAVVLRRGRVCYRGRIDDQWRALGARGEAGQRDLAEAIERACQGHPTPQPWPPVVGCLLPEPGPKTPR